MSPAKVEVGGHRGVADRLVHRGGPGPLVGAVRGEGGAAVGADGCVWVQPGRAGRTPAVHDRPSRAPIVEAPGWEAIDDRPPGPVRRRSQGDTWPSAARRSDGAPSSPRRSPARPRPSPRLVVTGRCRPGRHDPAGGAGPIVTSAPGGVTRIRPSGWQPARPGWRRRRRHAHLHCRGHTYVAKLAASRTRRPGSTGAPRRY